MNGYLKIFFGCLCSCFSPLFGATFYPMNTMSPLQCDLSSHFQNRIMIKNGRIKKVIAADCEWLSIQMEELTGQVFIYARDICPQETSISVVCDTGVIQDIHMRFTERMGEVVILENQEEIEEEKGRREPLKHTFKYVREIVAGNIPFGYRLSSIFSKKWRPRKGIECQLKKKLEGTFDDLYLYEIRNISRKREVFLEYEMECPGASWVYLESNVIEPKQKIFSILSVIK